MEKVYLLTYGDYADEFSALTIENEVGDEEDILRLVLEHPDNEVEIHNDDYHIGDATVQIFEGEYGRAIYDMYSDPDIIDYDSRKSENKVVFKQSEIEDFDKIIKDKYPFIINNGKKIY